MLEVQLVVLFIFKKAFRNTDAVMSLHPLFKVKLRARLLKVVSVETLSGTIAKVDVLSDRKERRPSDSAWMSFQHDSRRRGFGRQSRAQRRNSQGRNSLGSSLVTYRI